MAASSSYTSPKYNLQQDSDSPAIQRLIQTITNNVVKITQNVSQMENLNLQIGTSQDSEQIRSKLFQAENYTNQLAKETSKYLKELNDHVRNAVNNSSSFSSEEKQIKIQKERLTNELVKALNKFQEVQKSTMQKQKESNERAKANLVFNQSASSKSEETIRLQNMPSSTTDQNQKMTGYDTNPFDENAPESASKAASGGGVFQKQTQISMESDINLDQLREREAALRRLEHDITDVNCIFKDLALMVHDQGTMIDSIESNVERVQVSVTEANSQLESAKRNQSKARKKKFILASILAGVIGVILLVIILSVQPWD